MHPLFAARGEDGFGDRQTGPPAATARPRPSLGLSQPQCLVCKRGLRHGSFMRQAHSGRCPHCSSPPSLSPLGCWWLQLRKPSGPCLARPRAEDLQKVGEAGGPVRALGGGMGGGLPQGPPAGQGGHSQAAPAGLAALRVLRWSWGCGAGSWAGGAGGLGGGSSVEEVGAEAVRKRAPPWPAWHSRACTDFLGVLEEAQALGSTGGLPGLLGPSAPPCWPGPGCRPSGELSGARVAP